MELYAMLGVFIDAFFCLRSLYLLTFEDLSGSKRKFCKPPTVSPLIDHCPTAIGWCPSTWPARERRACTSGLLPLRVSWLSLFGGWFGDEAAKGRPQTTAVLFSNPPDPWQVFSCYQASSSQNQFATLIRWSSTANIPSALRTKDKGQGVTWRGEEGDFLKKIAIDQLALAPGTTLGGPNREASVRSLVVWQGSWDQEFPPFFFQQTDIKTWMFSMIILTYLTQFFLGRLYLIVFINFIWRVLSKHIFECFPFTTPSLGSKTLLGHPLIQFVWIRSFATQKCRSLCPGLAKGWSSNSKLGLGRSMWIYLLLVCIEDQYLKKTKTPVFHCRIWSREPEIAWFCCWGEDFDGKDHHFGCGGI